MFQLDQLMKVVLDQSIPFEEFISSTLSTVDFSWACSEDGTFSGDDCLDPLPRNKRNKSQRLIRILNSCKILDSLIAYYLITSAKICLQYFEKLFGVAVRYQVTLFHSDHFRRC